MINGLGDGGVANVDDRLDQLNGDGGICDQLRSFLRQVAQRREQVRRGGDEEGVRTGL